WDRELLGGTAELREVGCRVDPQDRVGRRVRDQTGPGERHRIPLPRLPALDGCAGPGLGDPGPDIREDGPLRRAADRHRLVLATGDPDRLRAALDRHVLAVTEVLPVVPDPVQVEVGDVRALSGERPGDLVVVADDDAGDAGEGVAGHV